MDYRQSSVDIPRPEYPMASESGPLCHSRSFLAGAIKVAGYTFDKIDEDKKRRWKGGKFDLAKAGLIKLGYDLHDGVLSKTINERNVSVSQDGEDLVVVVVEMA